MGKVFLGVMISFMLKLMASGWMMWSSMNRREEAAHLQEILVTKSAEGREYPGSRLSPVGNGTGEDSPAIQDIPSISEIRQLLLEPELTTPVPPQPTP